MPRLGIVGSGLIGGSFIRALAAGTDYELLAFDRRAETSELIRSACPNVVTMQLPAALTRRPETDSNANFTDLDAEAETLRRQHPAFWEAVSSCDIIIFCTPIDLIPHQVRLVSRLSTALMSDVGSTKHDLCSELEGLRFMGGHPMAGSERQGFECSRADMFQNAPYVLCPPPTDRYHGPLEADLNSLRSMAQSLGASPYVIDPETHDRIVASVSHLPHVAAAALVNTVGECGGLALDLSAGGFRDITRIASSDPGLWAEICLSSAPALLPALDAYAGHVERFRDAVETNDYESLYALFQAGRTTRDGLPLAGNGALLTASGLTVYVEDTPGSVAAITVLLAEAGISIRNVSLRNARQYEGGQLRIFVTDSIEQQKSLNILRSKGYDCE